MIADVNDNLNTLKEDFSICLQLYRMGEEEKAETYLTRCINNVNHLLYNCSKEQESYIRFLLLKDVHSICFTQQYSLYVA